MLQTKLVKTIIGSLWTRYFWAIIRSRLIPAFMYLLSSMFYFSYFMFDGKRGIPDNERWSFTTNPFEQTCRYLCLVLTCYHLVYEGFQMVRLRSDYWKDFDLHVAPLVSMLINIFMITYHVFDFRFLHKWLIPLAFVAMFALWLNFLQLL